MAGLLDSSPQYTDALGSQPVSTNLLDQRASLLDRAALGRPLNPADVNKADLDAATFFDEARKGLRRFGYSTIATTQAFAGTLLAPILPNVGNELIKEGLRTMEDMPGTLQPAVENWADVHDARSGALKFGSSVGEGLPSSALAVAGGLGGRALGAGVGALRGLRGPALEALAARTGFVGGMGTMLPAEGGESAMDLAQDPTAIANTTPWQRAGMVAGRGAVNAALENIVPQALVVPHFLGKAAKIQPGLRAGLRNVGLLGAEGALGEYGTEFAQDLTGQYVQNVAHPGLGYDFGKAHEAGLSGAATGVFLGGAGGAAQSAYSNIAAGRDKMGELADKVKVPKFPTIGDIATSLTRMVDNPEAFGRSMGNATMEGWAAAAEKAGVLKDYGIKGIDTAADYLTSVYDGTMRFIGKNIPDANDRQAFYLRAAQLRNMTQPQWEIFRRELETKSGQEFREDIGHAAVSMARRTAYGVKNVASFFYDTANGFYRSIRDRSAGLPGSGSPEPTEAQREEAISQLYAAVPGLKEKASALMQSPKQRAEFGTFIHNVMNDASYLESGINEEGARTTKSAPREKGIGPSGPGIPRPLGGDPAAAPSESVPPMEDRIRADILTKWAGYTGTDLRKILAGMREGRNNMTMDELSGRAAGAALTAAGGELRFRDYVSGVMQAHLGKTWDELPEATRTLMASTVDNNMGKAEAMYNATVTGIDQRQRSGEQQLSDQAGAIPSALEHLTGMEGEGTARAGAARGSDAGGTTGVTTEIGKRRRYSDEGDPLDEETEQRSPIDEEVFKRIMTSRGFHDDENTSLPITLHATNADVSAEKLSKLFGERITQRGKEDRWEKPRRGVHLATPDGKGLRLRFNPMSLAKILGVERFRNQFKPYMVEFNERPGASTEEVMFERFKSMLSELGSQGLHIAPELLGLPADHPLVHLTADIDYSNLHNDLILSREAGGKNVRTWADLSGITRQQTSPKRQLRRISKLASTTRGKRAKDFLAAVKVLKGSEDILDKRIFRAIWGRAKSAYRKGNPESQGHNPTDEELAHALLEYHATLPELVNLQEVRVRQRRAAAEIRAAYKGKLITPEQVDTLYQYYSGGKGVNLVDVKAITRGLEIEAFNRDEIDTRALGEQIYHTRQAIDTGATQFEDSMADSATGTLQGTIEQDWMDFQQTFAQKTQQRITRAIERAERRGEREGGQHIPMEDVVPLSQEITDRREKYAKGKTYTHPVDKTERKIIHSFDHGGDTYVVVANPTNKRLYNVYEATSGYLAANRQKTIADAERFVTRQDSKRAAAAADAFRKQHAPIPPRTKPEDIPISKPEATPVGEVPVQTFPAETGIETIREQEAAAAAAEAKTILEKTAKELVENFSKQFKALRETLKALIEKLPESLRADAAELLERLKPNAGLATTLVDLMQGGKSKSAIEFKMKREIENHKKAIQKLEKEATNISSATAEESSPAAEPKTEAPASGVTIHSGGAKGSDTAFGRIGTELGMSTIAHSFKGHTPQTGSGKAEVHTAEDLKQADTMLQAAAKYLGKNFPGVGTFVGKLLRRNYFQVKDSEAVVAVSTFTDRGIVKGGTGWAAYMGVAMGKPVHVYDQDKKVWKTWDGKKFAVSRRPPQYKTFAGIGTRELNEAGEAAIRDYLSSFKKEEKAAPTTPAEPSTSEEAAPVQPGEPVQPNSEVAATIEQRVKQLLEGVARLKSQVARDAMTKKVREAHDAILAMKGLTPETLKQALVKEFGPVIKTIVAIRERETKAAKRKRNAEIRATPSLTEITFGNRQRKYTLAELQTMVDKWSDKYLGGFKINLHIFEHQEGDSAGFTNFAEDRIFMSTKMANHIEFLSVLAHEFGHQLMAKALQNAPQAVKDKLVAAWKADVMKLRSGTLTNAEVMKLFGSAYNASWADRRAKAAGKTTAEWLQDTNEMSMAAALDTSEIEPPSYLSGEDQPVMKARNLAYETSFEEWFANQFANLITHDLNAEDQTPEMKSFWKSLIKAMKQFFEDVVSKLQPNETFKDWVKSLGGTAPTEETTTPDEEEEQAPPSEPPPPLDSDEPPPPDPPDGPRKRIEDYVFSRMGPHKVKILFGQKGTSRFEHKQTILDRLAAQRRAYVEDLKTAERAGNKKDIAAAKKAIAALEAKEQKLLNDTAVQGFMYLAAGTEEKAGQVEHLTFKAAFQIFFDENEKRILGQAFARGLAGKRLREIYKDDPEALAAINSNDFEAGAAYAFQVWSADPDAFQLGPRVETLFQKFLDFIRKLFDILTLEEKAELILNNLEGGQRYQDEISPVARKLDKDLAWQDRALNMAKDVGGLLKEGFDLLLSPTYERMIKTNNPALTKIAELLYQETGAEGNEGGMIQRGRKVYKQLQNELSRIFHGLDPEQLSALHLGMVHDVEPDDQQTAERWQQLKDWYVKMYTYQTDVGIDLKNAGMKRGYYPLPWSPEKVLKNKQAFLEMLAKYPQEMQKTKKTANEIYSSITSYIDRGEDLVNVMGKNKEPLAEANRARTLHFIKVEDRIAFMDDDPIHTAFRYMKQAVRQTEYVRSFGVESSKLDKLTNDAKKIYGATASDLALTNDFVDGAMGNKEIGMSRELKDLYGAMNVYQNYRLLPFSLFPSLVDPVGVAIRSGSMMDAWDTFAFSIKNMFNEWKGDYTRDFYETYAEDMGIIEHSGTTISAHNQFDGITLRGTTKSLNDKLFKYNLLNGWIRNNTIMATKVAQRFIHRAAEGLFKEHSDRYLTELGLTKDDVHFDKKQDRLLLRANELVAAGMPEKEALELETKLANAIEKFVRQSLLNPSAAELPNWASNPYLLPIAHLKSFTFAFNATILNRITHEFKHENYKPIALAAAYVPGMIAADFMKDMIAGFGEEPPYKKNWGLMDYFWQGVNRSGLTGTGQFMTSAGEDIMRGGNGYESWAGPAAQQFKQAVTAFGSGNGTAISNWMVKSLPLQPLYRQHLPGSEQTVVK